MTRSSRPVLSRLHQIIDELRVAVEPVEAAAPAHLNAAEVPRFIEHSFPSDPLQPAVDSADFALESWYETAFK